MIKLVDPAVTLLPDTIPNLERIEFCGRTCYNSREKIAPGTAKKFFEMIVHNGHESVLEHSNLVVKTLTDEATQNMREILQETEHIMGRPHYIRNCGNSNADALYCDNIWSGNLRAWRNVVKTFTGEALLYNLFGNSTLFEDIYLCYYRTVFGKDTYWFDVPDFTKRDRGILLEEDPEHRDEHKILTFDIVCDRAIANEIVRHRALSFSQQSTRYCNYSGEIHFVRPWWMHDDDSNFPEEKRMFEAATEDAEFFYNRIVEKGNKPQFARAWLPNCLATELCATGTVRMWRDFLKLRNTSAAHPDMQIIAEKIDALMRSLNAQNV